MKALYHSIDELKTEVKALRQDVSKGKGAVSVLIFLATLLATIIGFFNLSEIFISFVHVQYGYWTMS